MKQEIEHYTKVFDQERTQPAEGRLLFQPVPEVWRELERRSASLLIEKTGHDLCGHVINLLRRRPGARMLSLGCGPGGIELSLARVVPDAVISCLDVNQELLALGRETAAAEDLNVTFAQADLNTVGLPADSFDVVFCHASLHHVIELERLITQIRTALAPGGRLVVLDVVSRNGYLMWPESRTVVEAIWATLPERFKLNWTAYGTPKADARIWEADTSQSSMECIRSEAIIPLLEAQLRPIHFVAYFSISRRFFDTMYGPNYDLSLPLDRAIFEWVWQLDRHHVTTGTLRPETFFAIYERP